MKSQLTKVLYILLFQCFCTLCIFSQNTKGVSPSEEIKPSIAKDVWAVVVGISDYQNTEITDLQYSHVDASAFAYFLESPAGGNVSRDHIKTLINEKATAGQLASAFDWLLDKVKEGDQAIIYFSGHGDVERKTFSQPGFLLCWDAPAKVYMGGGTFGLSYLQEIISTLSTLNKSKVLLITDACHSGRLAGSEIGGSQATASNLSKQFANEVKLMSCQANELSLEGPQWGGGRGVFSYFLMKGLTGMADFNNDKLISLYEIEKYLSDKVPQATSPKSQIPVAFGIKNTLISTVNQASLDELIKSETSSINSNSEASQSRENREEKTVSVFEKYVLFKNAIKDKKLIEPPKECALDLFNEMKNNPMMTSEVTAMKSELAAAFQDEAQQAINDYLKAEMKELNNRLKYDLKYEKYPIYLNKAAELLGNNHYLYTSIKAREHYYTGLNYRLKGEQRNDSNLINKCIEEQNKAIALDPDAAYAYNELGYSYKRKKNYAQAIDNYRNAIRISPKWLFPYNNLLISLSKIGTKEEILKEAEQIKRNIGESYLFHFNLGVIYGEWEDWMNAKLHYEKALEFLKDDRDALYNLSYVYYQLKNYPEVEKIIQKLIADNPSDKDLYIPWITLKCNSNQNDEALKIFELALLNGFKNIESLEAEKDLVDFIKTDAYQNLKKKYISN